jgi:hypothetical protein
LELFCGNALMSILDDAIREHLELKRAHGADDAEVKRLEDEAFGPPQRPDEIDPFAEAPTEFLASPDEGPDGPGIFDEGARGGRRPNIADLQEAPPPAPAIEDELAPAPDAPPPSPADAASIPLPPPPGEESAAAPAGGSAAAPPADEAPPAAEPIADAGPNTEERHAIADQPTQMFDVQAHVDAEAAATEIPVEQPSPSDEELVDAAQDEPHAAPPAPEEDAGPELGAQPPLETRGPDAEVSGHPPAEAAPTEEESAEYDFANEQRLADELDRALDAPVSAEQALPGFEDAPAEGGGIFDFESEAHYEEDPSEEVLRRADARADEAEAHEEPPPDPDSPRGFVEPPSEEAPLDATVEQPRPNFDPPSEEIPHDQAAPGAEPAAEEDDDAFDPDTGHEDVLEDTPRFLEDAPEDDDLWFEQKPPKDFDLD